jgi:glycosyltransferase involved in cell wall biosynthesis/ADP-heptose:LPS heptosyltransferase
MRKVLFVGEHPYLTSGNGNMMNALLERVDYTKYDVTVYALSDLTYHFHHIVRQPQKYKVIPVYADRPADDPWQAHHLINLLKRYDFEIVLFVGIDVWRYAPSYGHMESIKANKNMVFACITQYDLMYIRKDWLMWLNFFDIPTVYSQFCHDMVKDYIPKSRYFRPPLVTPEVWQPRDESKKLEYLARLGQAVADDVFIFGFVGKNQFRKDPQRALKAFSLVKKEHPNVRFYLHCNVDDGVYNLRDYIDTLGLAAGDVFGSQQGAYYGPKEMTEIYHVFDCLVNTSYHEGLSWTLLEAMLCGVPIIATDTTAQTELIKDVGIAVPCTDLAYLPVYTINGQSYIETHAANLDLLVKSMKTVIEQPKTREGMIQAGFNKAKDWLAGVSDINGLLDDASKLRDARTGALSTREDAVLFVQHSSAGDVLMSTQCFKGIKERHKNIPLIYMTQEKFADIVMDNPYVDEVVSWDEMKIRQYKYVYNPHGEKILPGGWNNLDAKLHSLYPYFCKVEADEIFISPKRPADEIAELIEGIDYPIVVVHNTGQVIYRMYKHLDAALKNLPVAVVQVGSASDYPVNCALDLRDKLSWRETAWVMSKANIAVCVDSFNAHLAGALGIDSVVIFGPAPARVTQPRMQKGAKLVILESNKLDVCPITAGCWGQVTKEVCQTPCINTITPTKVKQAVQFLLSGGDE